VISDHHHTSEREQTMSGSLAVTWQELNNASSRIVATEGDIKNQLASLKSLVDGLGGTWQGAASSAYNDLYTKWNASAAQLFESLDGIAKMLAQAAQAYEQTETQLKGSFSA
jgi:WXG100 family type VII secretion target